MTENPASRRSAPGAEGLYHPSHEHDSCGVGFVVNIKGRRSHKLVQQAIEVYCTAEHAAVKPTPATAPGSCYSCHIASSRRRLIASAFTCPSRVRTGWVWCFYHATLMSEAAFKIYLPTLRPKRVNASSGGAMSLRTTQPSARPRKAASP